MIRDFIDFVTDEPLIGLLLAALVALIVGAGWYEYRYPCLRREQRGWVTSWVSTGAGSGYSTTRPNYVCLERGRR